MINNNRKLSWGDVREIRASYGEDLAVLAKRYGVCVSSIYNVLAYRTWKIVEPVTAEQRYIAKLEDEVKNLKELLKES